MCDPHREWGQKKMTGQQKKSLKSAQLISGPGFTVVVMVLIGALQSNHSK